MSTAKRRNTPVSHPAADSGQPKTIDFVNAPTYAASYCNNVGFQVLQNDVILTFGEILEADPERAVVERRARITMSATQSKVLLYMLAQNLKLYEAQNGPIAFPAGFEQKLAEVENAIR